VSYCELAAGCGLTNSLETVQLYDYCLSMGTMQCSMSLGHSQEEEESGHAPTLLIANYIMEMVFLQAFSVAND